MPAPSPAFDALYTAFQPEEPIADDLALAGLDFSDRDEVDRRIKEYLPASLVLRTEGDIVRASSIENLTSFRYGMKCFFEEGRALAKINHPNVVRVLNFFRANETVYMVMRY